MNSCFPSFDSIADYPSSTNFINVLREVSNNATTAVDQKTMLETITELRRMRKYQRELFEKTFDNIISRFLYIYIKSQRLKSFLLVFSSRCSMVPGLTFEF